MNHRHFHFLLLLISFFTLACNSSQPPADKAVSPVAEKEVVLERPHYKMNYYTSWTIDSTDTDYDIDSFFSLNTASNNGTICFFIFNEAVDEQTHLDAQIQAHLEKVIKHGEVTKFDSWGKYKGHGALIRGKILGALKGEVCIFVHSGDSCSFLNVSQYYNSDRETDLPGLKLIEKSFTLK
ncbi:MAG TPA: hypothetical protein VGO45_12835 [Bacteroidia bacterium]|jgi:hypothetical protein|nr:hypothetical protein [Bacteroidia bacterium]